MVIKTNRKTGNRFYGCSTYPKCQQTEPLNVNPGLNRSVKWNDRHDRGEVKQFFISIGARPSFVSAQGLAQPNGEVAKSLFLIRKSDTPVTDFASQLSYAIRKVLQRGELPFCTLLVEQAICDHLDLSGFVEPVPETSSEIGFETEHTVSDAAINKWLVTSCSENTKDKESYPETAFDSPRESEFLNKWVNSHLGPDAHKWLYPQAPIPLLMQNFGASDETGRRADFLLAIPGSKPLVIELDGPKEENEMRSRDKELNQIGIDVLRVPNAEIDNGAGPKLQSLVERFSEKTSFAETKEEETKLAEAIGLATDAARLQAAVMMALENGAIELEKQWDIAVSSESLPKTIIKAALADLSAMINAYMELFFPEALSPKLKPVTSASKANLTISLKTKETHSSILRVATDHDVVVCQAPIPVTFASDLEPPRVRPKLQIPDKEAKASLTVFLQTLFRKRSFRDLQSEAVCNALRGSDTVTLLPTGAGKSIIYQLAGMLLPGVTLVIDPIVALIEDQELGLKNNGISRVAGLRAKQGDRDELKRLQLGMSHGDYLYLLMSPERMLIPSFREALASMMKNTFVSLAVIDEAHCVSQWGHSFRFPYLQLAKNLRTHCSNPDTGSPTVLALTGTASRTVLKELIAEVGISLDDANSIIRPAKFDRPELSFSIKRIGKGGDIFPELASSLDELPEFFGSEKEAFYSSSGKLTNSGIIFAPRVRGKTHGLMKIREEVQGKLSIQPGIFGGRTPSENYTKPEWEAEKRQHAEAFKDNSNPLLVATSAFGMGIDKPNIRWTLHMGLPSSIEAFYQEAGRAGRDKQKSHCMLLFSEVDRKATDAMLSADGLEELNEWKKKLNNNNDDVSRALYFHLESFSSKTKEMEMLKRILANVGEGLKQASASLTYKKDEPKEENEMKSRVEKGLIRMSQAGLLADYTANYEKRIFNIRTNDFVLENCKAQVLSYVKKVQPAQLKKAKADLAELDALERRKQPLALCEFVVDFTYDTIEKSRRRMLLEAIQLARRCDSDAEIRQSLMDYLQEGMDVSRVTELAEREDIDFREWVELIDDITDASEAMEMRGVSIRLLEAYPDHAGLLSLRALTEALSSGGSETLIRDSLKTAFTSAIEKHLCSDRDVNDLIASLLDLSIEELPHIRAALLDLMNPGEDQAFVPEEAIYKRLADISKSWNEEERAIALQVITIHSVGVVVPGLRSRLEARATVSVQEV